MKQIFKYLAIGLIPVLWAWPGLYLYATMMTFGEMGIYLLPAFAALLLFCWHRVGRWSAGQDFPAKPIFGTLLAHLPMAALLGMEIASMKVTGLPGDAILWICAILSTSVRMPFYALCMSPVGSGSAMDVLLQGICTILPMAIGFWLGQIGAPFRVRTLILPLLASLLWGFGYEWAYLPLILLWLGWMGYDIFKWKKNQ